ncbi:hypothetical protein TNCV_1563841, partial [Trichonephila clavipes]
MRSMKGKVKRIFEGVWGEFNIRPKLIKENENYSEIDSYLNYEMASGMDMTRIPKRIEFLTIITG